MFSYNSFRKSLIFDRLVYNIQKQFRLRFEIANTIMAKTLPSHNTNSKISMHSTKIKISHKT